MTRPLVFISYSHKDDMEKERLLSHLRVLQRPGLIELWSDDRIAAGGNWEQDISLAMAQARLAILLITADFLTSDFIARKEVPRLLKLRQSEGLIVFPIIVKACAWRNIAWLTKMNVRPKNGKPIWSDSGSHVDEDLAAIAEEVAELIQKAGKDGKPSKIEARGLATSDTSNTDPAPRTKSPVGPKILLVDDKPRYRNFLRRALREYDCLESGSVSDARNVLSEHEDIAVIILDLDLGGGGRGTDLLEHLKDRGHPFRIIVLTEHQDLLPTEMAKAYKIFVYLAKGKEFFQSVQFEVDQALKDIERELLAKENEIDEFTYVILNRYPTPFTYIYQGLKSDLLAVETFLRQRDMLELLVHFSSVVLVCEYLMNSGKIKDLDSKIQDRINKPSLGDWFNIANEMMKWKKQLQGQFFLDQFADFFTSKSRKAIAELIEIRNKNVGHGAMHSDYEYQNLVKECEKLLIPLLQDYQFITQFLLCHISNVRKVKSGYEYRLKECTGANPQLLYSRRVFKSLLDADQVYLVKLGSGEVLSLHPFIILANCNECKQTEVFFYSKLSEGKLHYLSYRTGHRFTTKEYVEDFNDLLRKDEK